MKLQELFESFEISVLKDLQHRLQLSKYGKNSEFYFERGELVARYFGNLETEETEKLIKEIISVVEKDHHVKIQMHVGEKNYIYFEVQAKTSE